MADTPIAPAPQATTAAVAHEGGEAQGNFPPFEAGTFPSQLLWLAISFGALYYYLNKKALPQIAALISARRARIAKDIDDATAFQRQADAAAAAHEKALADARAEAQAMAQAAKDEAARKADASRKAVEDDLAKKLRAAEERIGATRASAMSNVETIARDAAGAIVEKLIGRTPDPSAVSAAVDAAKAT